MANNPENKGSNDTQLILHALDKTNEKIDKNYDTLREDIQLMASTFRQNMIMLEDRMNKKIDDEVNALEGRVKALEVSDKENGKITAKSAGRIGVIVVVVTAALTPVVGFFLKWFK